MNTADLPTQVRDMWRTRPLRARNAPLAGICGGFARRYQVDATLVRAVVLGLTVLGGLGALIYIIGFFVLPAEPDTHAADDDRGPSTFATIAVAFAAVVIGGNFNSSLPGAGLISVALMAAGWYALHQRLPVPPPGTAVSNPLPVPAPVPAGAWQPPGQHLAWQPIPHPQAGIEPDRIEPDATVSLTKPAREPRTDGATTPAPAPGGPPQWDPLGAAPFAWDLPEPSPAPAPTPPRPAIRKSRITPVTLGLALLALAAIAALNTIGITHISPTVASAVILAVIGCGLIVGAFRRTGYGLLAVAIPLAGFVIIGAVAENVINAADGAERGEVAITVTNPAELAQEYRVSAGQLVLDLRDLNLDTDRTVATDVSVGETIITVPASMNLEVTCEVNFGDTQCPQGPVAGADPQGPTLTLDARGNLGRVEINRV